MNEKEILKDFVKAVKVENGEMPDEICILYLFVVTCISASTTKVTLSECGSATRTVHQSARLRLQKLSISFGVHTIATSKKLNP